MGQEHGAVRENRSIHVAGVDKFNLKLVLPKECNQIMNEHDWVWNNETLKVINDWMRSDNGGLVDRRVVCGIVARELMPAMSWSMYRPEDGENNIGGIEAVRMLLGISKFGGRAETIDSSQTVLDDYIGNCVQILSNEPDTDTMSEWVQYVAKRFNSRDVNLTDKYVKAMDDLYENMYGIDDVGEKIDWYTSKLFIETGSQSRGEVRKLVTGATKWLVFRGKLSEEENVMVDDVFAKAWMSVNYRADQMGFVNLMTRNWTTMHKLEHESGQQGIVCDLFREYGLINLGMYSVDQLKKQWVERPKKNFGIIVKSCDDHNLAVTGHSLDTLFESAEKLDLEVVCMEVIGDRDNFRRVLELQRNASIEKPSFVIIDHHSFGPSIYWGDNKYEQTSVEDMRGKTLKSVWEGWLNQVPVFLGGCKVGSANGLMSEWAKLTNGKVKAQVIAGRTENFRVEQGENGVEICCDQTGIGVINESTSDGDLWSSKKAKIDECWDQLIGSSAEMTKIFNDPMSLLIVLDKLYGERIIKVINEITDGSNLGIYISKMRGFGGNVVSTWTKDEYIKAYSGRVPNPVGIHVNTNDLKDSSSNVTMPGGVADKIVEACIDQHKSGIGSGILIGVYNKRNQVLGGVSIDIGNILPSMIDNKPKDGITE